MMKQQQLPRIPGNTTYKKAIELLNKDLRNAGAENDGTFFSRYEIHNLFKHWKGRCAYCGYPLDPRSFRFGDGLFLQLYIPFERGGEINLDNLVPCCKRDYKRYRPRMENRERIPDVNTIADLIDVLIDTRVKLGTSENPHLEYGKIDRVKKVLNLLFEDLAINMRYKPYKDWIPDEYSLIIENDNTIPDVVDEIAAIKTGQVEGDVVQSRKKLTENLKQMETTRQYKILRNTDE